MIEFLPQAKLEAPYVRNGTLVHHLKRSTWGFDM